MRSVILAVALVLTACTMPAAPNAPACEISAQDREWINGALDAWRFSANEITGVRNMRPFEAVLFDDDCVLTSPNAFSAATVAEVTWTATPHIGEITLPGGQPMPAGVTSFASADGDQAFFVMSTPSVWRAAGVSNDALGLETMMIGVLLHEGSHVAQLDAYGARITAIETASHLPGDDINDDMVQNRFGENAAFAASVDRETELLFQVAHTRDDARSAAPRTRSTRSDADAPSALVHRCRFLPCRGRGYMADARRLWSMGRLPMDRASLWRRRRVGRGHGELRAPWPLVVTERGDRAGVRGRSARRLRLEAPRIR